MKLLRIVPIAAVLYVLFFTGSTTMTSCTKETDTVHVRDTIIDTLIVKDTTCRLYAGLVAYYNFNGGNLNDSSGYGNNIIFNNATATADRWGNPGNAYLFNGTDSYMRVKNSNSLNPDKISLVARVKVNGFYSGYCHGNDILSKGSPDEVKGLYYLRMKDKTACGTTPDFNTEFVYGTFGDNAGAPYYAASADPDSIQIVTGKWYAFVYTFDGTTARFYIDGVLKKEITRSTIFTPNTQDLYIGKNGNAQYSYFFNGAIDEIRIYNRPLNNNEVKQLYDLTN